MSIIRKAIVRAIDAHAGQKRKNGLDYFSGHVEPVASLVWNNYQENVSRLKRNLEPLLSQAGLTCAAYLHDVLEDTNHTIEDFPEAIQEVVVAFLTKRANENYFDFIFRIKKSTDATLIKLADLTHNMSDLEEGSLKDKYRFAKYILEQDLYVN